MHYGIITRPNNHIWGGDLGVIYPLARGLEQLGHKVSFSSSALALQEADYLVVTNLYNPRENEEMLSVVEKPFAVVGFNEDLLTYHTPATGFENYVFHCLGYGMDTDDGLEFSIDKLLEMPHIVHYYGETPKRSPLYNYSLMRKANLCIASSAKEASYIQRDYPSCSTGIVPIVPGNVTEYTGTPDDRFLTWTGLNSKSYVLQVGRLERRKNQLGTILAMRNFDIPLVFIATRAFTVEYEAACVEAALRWRTAPTLFISQNLRPFEKGHVKCISMPLIEGESKIPQETLLSAYYHAGLHLHPAFQELPGLTYLEAARLGTPTIASSWCTITDYFFDEKLGHSNLDGRIVYTLPHHIREIETLIPQMFGKTFAPVDDHPALTYKEIDAGRAFNTLVNSRLQ